MDEHKEFLNLVSKLFEAIKGHKSHTALNALNMAKILWHEHSDNTIDAMMEGATGDLAKPSESPATSRSSNASS